MSWCDVASDVASEGLCSDVGVVEPILFNLVDNAAKYAGRADDRRIHIDVKRQTVTPFLRYVTTAPAHAMGERRTIDTSYSLQDYCDNFRSGRRLWFASFDNEVTA